MFLAQCFFLHEIIISWAHLYILWPPTCGHVRQWSQAYKQPAVVLYEHNGDLLITNQGSRF